MPQMVTRASHSAWSLTRRYAHFVQRLPRNLFTVALSARPGQTTRIERGRGALPTSAKVIMPGALGPSQAAHRRASSRERLVREALKTRDSNAHLS